MSPVAQVVLVLAALLCALVAGFLFAFAVVVMPGLKALPDREFLEAFRKIDGVIQRGNALFGLVWMGSALAVIAALVLGVVQRGGVELRLIVLAASIYLLGVQLPTFLVNVPLNNGLQALDIEAADGPTLQSARARFEPRWNRWNGIRTGLAALSTALLLVSLLAA